MKKLIYIFLVCLICFAPGRTFADIDEWNGIGISTLDTWNGITISSGIDTINGQTVASAGETYAYHETAETTGACETWDDTDSWDFDYNAVVLSGTDSITLFDERCS